MIVHTESKSLLIRTSNPQAIKNLLPRHQEIDYEGHCLAVPHRLDEVRVLRNIGIQAPPPILFYYDWPGKWTPKEHQRETAAFFTLYNRCYCFNQMGTMKTASALWAADYLMNVKQVQRALVVAPLSTLQVVWLEEVFNCLMHRRAVILHGSRSRRQKLLDTDTDIYIINHDGLEVLSKDLAGRSDINLVIADDCDVYRNSQTDLYANFVKTVEKRRLWLMSGTPFPNAPTDAWALARLVNKARVPMYFSHWRRQTMLQIKQYKWVPRKDSYELAYNACQPAIRFLKKDCVDLPPITTVKYQAELSKEQRAAFTKMHNEAVIHAKNHQITAVHAADKISKLRQILCGVVKDTATGDYVEIDHKPRFDLLLNCVQQADTKVIIVVPFKGILRVLARQLQPHYTLEIINGDVSLTARNDIINRFRRQKDPHLLLCHPRVMSHGLNLHEAATIIFYGPIYSASQWQQVQDRIARPGQEHDMTLVRMAAHRIEWEIYRIIDEKGVTQENILSLYKNEVLGVKPAY